MQGIILPRVEFLLTTYCNSLMNYACTYQCTTLRCNQHPNIYDLQLQLGDSHNPSQQEETQWTAGSIGTARNSLGWIGKPFQTITMTSARGIGHHHRHQLAGRSFLDELKNQQASRYTKTINRQGSIARAQQYNFLTGEPTRSRAFRGVLWDFADFF